MTRRHKKQLTTLLIALLLFASGIISEHAGWNNQLTKTAEVVDQATMAGYYSVKSFEDGDTIVVDMNGTEERIRFIGVDTPETKDPRKPVQCFGKAASQFTKNLIGQGKVRLESDPENTNRDRYNRLLRYVYLENGTLVNSEIIKQGYGFAYTSFPFTKKDQFKKLETEARQNNLGLWSGCSPQPNDYGGYTSNPETNP